MTAGEAPPARLLLVGMMGAGKTTVGRAVAAAKGWAYLDSDEEVAKATGETVPALFEHRGEAAFRAAEAEALRRAVTGGEPVVVSVAGGAVLDPANRELLGRSGTVVWLRARPETLARRVGDGFGRPLLGEDPASAIVRLEAVRRPLYQRVAQHVVDVDDLGTDQVVDRVLEMLPGP